jgi:4-oxalocrotonate tautomerase
MPYVNIKITKEGGPNDQGPTAEQKAKLIEGVTELLSRVLHKNPATTVVIIDEISLDNWGIGGLPVTAFREQG